MEGIGIDKLLLILVIVLVLFGAKRVPEIGASIGKGIRELKRGMSELGEDVGNPAAHGVNRSPRSAAQSEQSRQLDAEPRRLLPK
jgi:sec-independent protein translocase protein TatA